jgi:hypothetical protein
LKLPVQAAAAAADGNLQLLCCADMPNHPAKSRKSYSITERIQMQVIFENQGKFLQDRFPWYATTP